MSKLSVRVRSVIFSALLFAPVMAKAQQLSTEQNLKHGEEVFAQTCTQSYCHGAAGAAGGAPKLAGRGLTGDYIERVVTFGIPGTPMPAWGQILPLNEVRAAIAYVQSLNGIAPSMRSGPPPTLTGEAAHGRDLFFDPQHSVRCSSCHRVNDRGLQVTPALGNLPADVAALRNLATSQVSTATAGSDTFPALLSSKIPTETKIYDLTKFPPVLRTFSPASVEMKDGSGWKHSQVLGNYSDEDLGAILAFLRAAR
jgi:mono/diheme cytochrome c family protein